MSATNSPHLGFNLLSLSQSSKEVTANAAFVTLDAILNTAAKNQTTAAPPGSPADGDVYIIAPSATGAWLGKDGQVAYYNAGAGWGYVTPNTGLTLWDAASAALYTYVAGTWTKSSLIPTAGLITFNNAGSDMKAIINKHATGDIGSFLFQTNGSERAEFGCLGDDNFTLKVSPDGSTLFNALKILCASGRVAFKANGTGLTAAGTNQGTALALTNQFNEFTTTASGTGGRLPTPEPGEFFGVVNSGSNPLALYPATGGAINALGTNAAYTIPATSRALLWAVSATKWYTFLSA